MYLKFILPIAITAAFVLGISGIEAQQAHATITLDLESCFNGATFTVQGEPGTAGTLDVDYALGTFLAGGDGLLGHGFGNRLAFGSGHFITAAENGFISTPTSGFNFIGALEDAVAHTNQKF